MTHDDVSPVQTILDGRASWLWPDGTVLPVVSGGDGPDGDGSGGAGGDAGSDAAGDAGNAGAAGNDDGQGQGEGADEGKATKVEFTPEQQAELGRRIAAERATAAAAARKTAEQEAKTAAERAKMDEADRLKAEKADAETKAAEAVARANGRVVRTEVKAAALAAKVNPETVDDFMALVKLDGIEVDDEGEVDAKAIAKAVADVLTKPTYKAAFLEQPTGRRGASGGDMNGTPAKGRAKTLEDAVTAAYS